MRNFSISILLCLGLIGYHTGYGQVKMVKAKIHEGISGRLPKTFYPMPPSDIALRFPSVRKPIAAYTDESRLTDFSVKISASKWRSQDLPMLRDFFRSSILNLYDRVNFIQDSIVVINDREFAVFEFETYIAGEQFSLDKKSPARKYHYLQYALLNGKTLVFSFSTPKKLMGQWQETAGEIMASIKIKDKI